MNEYIENDRFNAPFLLAASKNGLIQFTGSYIKNGILYWKFTPYENALTLVTRLNTRTEPHIPTKDLYLALETFWKQVSKMKNERSLNGKLKRY